MPFQAPRPLSPAGAPSSASERQADAKDDALALAWGIAGRDVAARRVGEIRLAARVGRGRCQRGQRSLGIGRRDIGLRGQESPSAAQLICAKTLAGTLRKTIVANVLGFEICMASYLQRRRLAKLHGNTTEESYRPLGIARHDRGNWSSAVTNRLDARKLQSGYNKHWVARVLRVRPPKRISSLAFAKARERSGLPGHVRCLCTLSDQAG